MALTRLSKELRKIRIDHEINRTQMAKRIGLSEKQLADIEIGRTLMTDEILDEIRDKFLDSSDQKSAVIWSAAMESTSQLTFDFAIMSVSQKSRVFALKRQIDEENRKISTEIAQEEAVKPKLKVLV